MKPSSGEKPPLSSSSMSHTCLGVRSHDGSVWPSLARLWRRPSSAIKSLSALRTARWATHRVDQWSWNQPPWMGRRRRHGGRWDLTQSTNAGDTRRSCHVHRGRCHSVHPRRTGLYPSSEPRRSSLRVLLAGNEVWLALLRPCRLRARFVPMACQRCAGRVHNPRLLVRPSVSAAEGSASPPQLVGPATGGASGPAP